MFVGYLHVTKISKNMHAGMQENCLEYTNAGWYVFNAWDYDMEARQHTFFCFIFYFLFHNIGRTLFCCVNIWQWRLVAFCSISSVGQHWTCVCVCVCVPCPFIAWDSEVNEHGATSTQKYTPRIICVAKVILLKRSITAITARYSLNSNTIIDQCTK